MCKRRNALILIALAALAPAPARADGSSLPDLETQVEDRRFRLLGHGDYSIISSSGQSSLSAFGFGLGGEYAMAKRIGLGVDLSQGYGSLGGGALFTSVGAHLVYAWTGSISRTVSTTTVNHAPAITSREGASGGFRTSLSASQYFFNGAAGVYPLTGAGLAATYEIPSAWDFAFELGARLDLLVNGKRSSKVMHFLAGLVFWL